MSKYEIVYKDICNKISQRVYKLGELLPTEKEMTEYYNVSRITIQKAMQMLTSQGIVERTPGRGTVLKTIPPALSGGMGSRFISLLIPSSTPEMMSMVYAVQEFAGRKNYNLTIHMTNRDEGNEDDMVSTIEKIIDDGSQGIIIYPPDSGHNKHFFRTLGKRIPFVTIDKTINNTISNAVISDNFNGAYNLTEHIIQNNHKKIGYLYFTTDADSLAFRRRGFVAALEENFIPVKPEYFQSVEHMYKVEERLEYLLKTVWKDITAIVFCTDEMAVRGSQWMMRNGYSIPDDISVCGFDDTAIGRAMIPALTTSQQDFSAIGREASRLLFNVIETEDEKTNVVYIPTKLIVRNTVKKI